MGQYTKNLQSQNSNCSQLNSGMIRPSPWTEIGERVDERKND